MLFEQVKWPFISHFPLPFTALTTLLASSETSGFSLVPCREQFRSAVTNLQRQLRLRQFISSTTDWHVISHFCTTYLFYYSSIHLPPAPSFSPAFIPYLIRSRVKAVADPEDDSEDRLITFATQTPAAAAAPVTATNLCDYTNRLQYLQSSRILE